MLVLGHGNPHFTPTFYSLSLSPFLPLYFYTNISFSPTPSFLCCQFKKTKKVLLWNFSGMSVILTPTCILVSLFVILRIPICMLVLGIFLLCFFRSWVADPCFLCDVLVDHNMRLFFISLMSFADWAVIFAGKTKKSFFLGSTLTVCPIFITVVSFNMCNLLLSFYSVSNYDPIGSLYAFLIIMW